MFLTFEESEKWDGFNLPLLEYIRRLYQRCQIEFNNTGPKTSLHYTLSNAIDFLQMLYLLNVNCTKKLKEIPQIQILLIKFGKLDVFCRNIDEQREQETGERSLYDSVSFFLQQITRASVKGFAKEVILQFNIDDRPCGIDIIFR